MTLRILFRDKKFSRTENDVLSLIISLALNKGYCYATNDYLKEYINSSVRTINYSLSKLSKVNCIIIRYVNSKRRIFLNMEKIPTKVVDEGAESFNKRSASSCTHNINNNNKYKIKKRNENIPEWMKHPEMCVSIPLSEEEQKEMDELVSIINERRDVYDWRI